MHLIPSDKLTRILLRSFVEIKRNSFQAINKSRVVPVHINNRRYFSRTERVENMYLHRHDFYAVYKSLSAFDSL